jgi:hypothetical protein
MPARVVNRTVQVSAIYGFVFYIYMQNICCGGRGKYSNSAYSGYCEGIQYSRLRYQGSGGRGRAEKGKEAKLRKMFP